jgi:hypothetical protein
MICKYVRNVGCQVASGLRLAMLSQKDGAGCDLAAIEIRFTAMELLGNLNAANNSEYCEVALWIS